MDLVNKTQPQLLKQTHFLILAFVVVVVVEVGYNSIMYKTQLKKLIFFVFL
jgi:hypothetical protein